MVAVAEAVREKLHRRALAGDGRAGRWSRGQARNRQYAYLRLNWPRLPLYGVVSLAVSPFLLLLPGWLRWLAAGALIASTVWMVTLHVMLATGTAMQMVGEFGERCTAAELRRLKGDWRVVNAVELQRFTGDIDHVAVGSAGIIAIETKWIGSCRDSELGRRTRDAVAQLRQSAGWLNAMFKNGVPDEAHHKVVVLWGPAADGWDHPTDVDGVVVLAGRDLRSWLEQQPPGLLCDETVDRVWKTLVRTVERRDERNAAVDGPAPQSLGRLAVQPVGLVVATVLGFVAALKEIGPYPRVPMALAAFAFLVCAGVTVRRVRAIAPYALACIAGAVCATGLVLLAAFLASP